jgi:hypothetical protein
MGKGSLLPLPFLCREFLSNSRKSMMDPSTRVYSVIIFLAAEAEPVAKFTY